MDERYMEIASELEAQSREVAIANATAQRHDPDRALFDGAHCVEEDCGDEIPAGRLALGKIRCVTCQAAKEKRRGWA